MNAWPVLCGAMLDDVPAAGPELDRRKPFGAAVKFRAGGWHVVEHDAAQHRPCVHRSILASTAGPWAQPTRWHLEGLTTKAYRVTRGIQLIEQSRAEPAASADSAVDPI